MSNESPFINDLRDCSFDEWLAFAFDHPVPVGEEPGCWLEARHCKEAALHGLNHIATPEERAVIVDPILALPLDEKLLAYARECRAGRAP